MTGTASKAAGLVGLWVLVAGTLGANWAISAVETALDDAANELPAVQQARMDGTKLAWNGNNVEVSSAPDALSEARLVKVLSSLDGIGSVSLDGPPSDIAASALTLSTPVITTLPLATTSITTLPLSTTSSAAVSSVADSTTSAVPATTETPVSEEAQALDTLLSGRTITFVFSTAIPSPESELILDELTALLNTYPELLLHFVGHSDSDGFEHTNQTLSAARAQSVANHLIIGGIDATRFTVEGRGSQQPLTGDESDAGKEINRRVEIEIATPQTQGDN